MTEGQVQYTVQSEIYSEIDLQSERKSESGNEISKFYFTCPNEKELNGYSLQEDEDGDLILPRRQFLQLEHSKSTVLKLVGLQVWRGAFLINDYIIHFRERFQGKNVLELGSGVGLTSIVASFYGKRIVCTDLDIGGILGLIERNIKLNDHLLHTGSISVCELDFLSEQWSPELIQQVQETNYVLAADVIYDDRITKGFINTIKMLFDTNKKIKMLMALEKRYVFTVSDLDSVAPCFAFFLDNFNQQLGTQLLLQFLPTDFPQYFEYDRVKELVLMQITSI